ncbi:MAG: hypothetical protein HDS16_04870 [Bacteroides sp.]|nr:hypothetical protein [Bacteroides sp.]
MKKIMFNDRYELTQAVLDGHKTMTRRIVSEKLWDKWTEYDDFCGSVGVVGLAEIGVGVTREYSNCEKFFIDNSPIKIGEVIAIAQAYADVGFGDTAPIIGMDENDMPIIASDAGLYNKMFVCADLMPHQIRITNVRVERLQDISDEDCIKEGIYMDEDPMNPQAFIYTYPNAPQWFFTPREAFASLIDKVSGKGTWESNPYVFAYEFKLVK